MLAAGRHAARATAGAPDSNVCEICKQAGSSCNCFYHDKYSEIVSSIICSNSACDPSQAAGGGLPNRFLTTDEGKPPGRCPPAICRRSTEGESLSPSSSPPPDSSSSMAQRSLSPVRLSAHLTCSSSNPMEKLSRASPTGGGRWTEAGRGGRDNDSRGDGCAACEEDWLLLMSGMDSRWSMARERELLCTCRASALASGEIPMVCRAVSSSELSDMMLNVLDKILVVVWQKNTVTQGTAAQWRKWNGGSSKGGGHCGRSRLSGCCNCNQHISSLHAFDATCVAVSQVPELNVKSHNGCDLCHG